MLQNDQVFFRAEIHKLKGLCMKYVVSSESAFGFLRLGLVTFPQDDFYGCERGQTKDNRDRIYSGQVKNGMCHGYGEIENHLGYFSQGERRGFGK
jgi:hypothetical protein